MTREIFSESIAYTSHQNVEIGTFNSSSSKNRIQQRGESATTIQAMQRIFWFPNKDTQNSIDEGKKIILILIYLIKNYLSYSNIFNM